MNREAERYRLITMLYDSKIIHDHTINEGVAHHTILKLADHLLDNGIVVPPCKVGQTVWEVVSWDKNVRECRVSSLTQKADGTFKIRLTNLKSKSVYERVPQHIGDIIFLTREEAEKMLKGSKNNG